MKKILLLLISVFAMLSCINDGAIKSLDGTSWYGVGDDNDKQIHFNDSTCYFLDTSKATGYVDTIQMYYNVNNDTISFVPFDEYISIGSKLVVTKDGLMEAKHGVIIFKQKQP